MKKLNIQSILIGIIIGVVLCSSVFAGEEIVQYIFTKSTCKLFVDNVEYSNPDIPITLFMRNDSNFTPVAVLRDLCNKLGIPFEYDNTTKEIRITTTNVTIDTVGKEETTLMSETVGTTIEETTENNIIEYEEDNVLIVETNNEKYVQVYSIQKKLENSNYKFYPNTSDSYILQKKNGDKYENITEIIKGYSDLFKPYKERIFKTGGFYIKYNDYVNIIQPLIGE